jgi:hypothetical protein
VLDEVDAGDREQGVRDPGTLAWGDEVAERIAEQGVRRRVLRSLEQRAAARGRGA